MSATKPLPAHIRRTLVEQGKLTNDGLGRRAQLRACAHCRATVIVGLDAPILAMRTVCDATQLDQITEAICLLTGTPTYTLIGQEITPRDQWAIKAGMPHPVIPMHQCETPRTPSPRILAQFTRTTPATNEKVPY